MGSSHGTTKGVFHKKSWKMIKNISNLYEELEKEICDLVRCSITFSVSHGI